MIFNFSAKELQLALVRHWRLPDLLVSMMDEKHIDNARVRTVQLAASLSRHTAQGWNNPAIPDDLSAIESLLHIGREHLLNRVSAPHEAIEPLLAAGGRAEGAAAGLRALRLTSCRSGTPGLPSAASPPRSRPRAPAGGC
jgi:hypothetical protein